MISPSCHRKPQDCRLFMYARQSATTNPSGDAMLSRGSPTGQDRSALELRVRSEANRQTDR
eukprot:4728445-Alexandrium_andersonii.AAC.1